MQTQGKYSVGYFTNWGIYDRKFAPNLIPARDLTHLLYAFAKIDHSGKVMLSDPWADVEIHHEGSAETAGRNLYGNLEAIYKLKHENPHLKTLLSIGGWSYRESFHPIVVNSSLRAHFVRSSVQLLEDYGFDGLDIDYEYPSNPQQAIGFAELLRELRFALDEHAEAKNRLLGGRYCRFLLTIAVPCSAWSYQVFDMQYSGGEHHARGSDFGERLLHHIAKPLLPALHKHGLRGPSPSQKQSLISMMDQSLDFWNLMAYDFSGTGDPEGVADHQANLYGENISGVKAVEFYESRGVHRSKLVLGFPLYGRSFAGAQGIGQDYDRSRQGGGTWESGSYDYRFLPTPGSQVYVDQGKVASYSYDGNSGELVTYDNDAVAAMKARWIQENGLGGSMYWELSGDKDTGYHHRVVEGEGSPGKEYVPGPSLVQVVNQYIGPLDMTPNWVRYEGSQYDNIRNQMGRPPR
ncbi:glycoside hydrolase family 18 protein [Coniophora puteana RWD-64-598 SS2]|uniref:Glycoside hydrolase family 18 protein n=1 Tax=Coniophora puteana (strain RWD-64-598) TaxID=741705 RepID=A0A5M3MVW1_CONPW|nr:glycoside hydrolase family 18 protein [Coniophora puteana RWD-64-598 SS2]EIW83147.1 glycoside hydrolase family 18 protein [Coniophora puteana RWD-64-598 SS2]